jgi:ABC-2 type transport system permease protein
VPMLVITPLSFLGGAFYSIEMLPEAWRTVSLFNPIVYVISGFRWSFYGSGDVAFGISVAALCGFLATCLVLVWLIFRSGYRLKN